MDAPPSTPARTWAEIDLTALRHNADAIRSLLAPGAGVMAVVKANAYGHGAPAAVRALTGRVEWFGVANVTEAQEVRAHDPATPVFLLGPALPGERGAVAAGGFVPAVSDLAEARAYAALGAERGWPVPIHLALDTGMGRIGVWEEEAAGAVREIAALRGIALTGLASHLPVADEDDAWTADQLARFHRLAATLRALLPAGAPAPLLHVSNSAGAIGFAPHAGDLVRAGLSLYGSAPRPEFQARLRPVLAWKTRVTLVRDVGPGRGISYGRTFITPRAMRVATLAVGYADGFQRHLTGRGAEVLLGGQRCPVLGRVTMDQIMVDASALPACQPGDEAVLLGRQGAEEILAAELAGKAGTIAWEIFTGIGARVRRVNLES